MSRGLSAGQISTLTPTSNVVEFLIDLVSATTTRRFTTGQFDVDYNSNTYSKDSDIQTMSSVFGEDADISGTPFSISFATTDTTFIDDVATTESRNATTVSVTLLTRDSSTLSPDTTNAIKLYEGLLDSVELNQTKSNQILTMNFTNQIGYGFKNEIGRKMNSLSVLSQTTADRNRWTG